MCRTPRLPPTSAPSPRSWSRATRTVRPPTRTSSTTRPAGGASSAGWSDRDPEPARVGESVDHDPGEVLGRLRIARVEVVERVVKDVRHGEIPEPLLVRRDDVPRRLVGRAARQRILVGGDVLVPVLPL